MPYVVTCPKCATKLKSAQPVPAGKSASCPKCKTVFTLTEPAPELDDAADARPRPAPSAARISKPARRDEDDQPRSRRRDDEYDDRPRSRRRDDDEEDERPRSKRRPTDEEDEDDRPRGKRRPVDDEEDDVRPKSRKRREEDEEDEDRSRSRKRRGGDDEDDDVPPPRRGRRRGDDEEDEDDDRPRSRRGKKKSRKGLILLLAGLAALFLLFVGGAAVMYFVDPFGLFGGGGGSADMMAWLPSDTQQVEGMDVAEVAKNPKALKAVRSDLKDVEALGIKAEDVASVIQGKKSKGPTADVTIVKLKASADKDKVAKAAGGTDATANGKKYFKTTGGGGLFFASDKIVVLTRSDKVMADLLQKEDGKVIVNDELKAAVKRTDGQVWMAAVGQSANMFGGGGGPGGKGAFPGLNAPPPPKSAVLSGKLAGEDLSIKMEFTYADADTAKKAADAIEGLFKFLKDFMGGMEKMAGKGANPAMQKMQDQKKVFDTIKVSASGSAVTITMTAPVETFEGMNKAGGFGP